MFWNQAEQSLKPEYWVLTILNQAKRFSTCVSEGVIIPPTYTIIFLNYHNSKSHTQTIEEIMLIFVCWTLIHIECEVRCRKSIMNLVSQEARKILLEKY